MKLSLRFALDNVFVIGAAFLAVSAVAFSASVAGWLAFGVSTGFTVLAGASVATMRRRSQDHRRADRGLIIPDFPDYPCASGDGFRAVPASCYPAMGNSGAAE
jgi:hypothetical protein